MKKLIFSLLAVSALASPALAKVKVVASITILADMARNVGGDAVDVVSLVGPDGDAHVYEPVPADLKSVSGAQVLILNGLGLEGWMKRLAGATSFKGLTITASNGVAPRQMDEDGKTVLDPHAWQDLSNGIIYANNIADGLCAADAADCDGFRKNAAAYAAALKDEDAKVRAAIATVPEGRRIVVTTHDAFGYFAGAYGVKFLAPEGFSTDVEPNAAHLAALVRQVKELHVTALFFENMSDKRLIAAVARETGVTPGPALYADALSKPGAGADSYLGLFEHNVPLLVAAMKGGVDN